MTLDDVIYEFGKSQLIVIELQKSYQSLAAKNTELMKQIESTKETSTDSATPAP